MLTLQFIPHAELSKLPADERLKRLLALAKEEKIILLEGKLASSEKSELISKTMAEISPKFKGIEIEELDLEAQDKALIETIRSMFINMLLGNRKGFTIIGPATVVKEIKKDPNKIQLFTNDKKKR